MEWLLDGVFAKLESEWPLKLELLYMLFKKQLWQLNLIYGFNNMTFLQKLKFVSLISNCNPN
jgi:hypothetical protein